MLRSLRLALAVVASWLAISATALAQADPPKQYECRRARSPIVIDGHLEKAAWREAPWSDWFVDIQGSRMPKPRFQTRVKLLWDEQYLYVAAELEEPDVWATLMQHDTVIFHDNDFEVFLNPTNDGKRYFEFEMNALNTSWDLFLPKPYNQDGHPDNSWEIPGLKSAVRIDGTLNHPGDKDHGWTLEIAFPWNAFTERSGKGRPAPGESWRINFSRVEWRVQVANGRYQKLPGPEDNWVWSPQGVINMHVPEKWGTVHFLGR
jgi:hypothetical protein